MCIRDRYYLLGTHGTCCDGPNSTYNIVVGRSRKITGPSVGTVSICLGKYCVWNLSLIHISDRPHHYWYPPVRYGICDAGAFPYSCPCVERCSGSVSYTHLAAGNKDIPFHCYFFFRFSLSIAKKSCKSACASASIRPASMPG